jgi:hypothetical protein
VSAANRRRGHDAERAVVLWLRAHGYPDAHTTRSQLGHDGFHAPGDVVGPVGLVIEVKDVAASCWPTWCRQARLEAEGRPWVVVRRIRGRGDVGGVGSRPPTRPAASGPTTSPRSSTASPSNEKAGSKRCRSAKTMHAKRSQDLNPPDGSIAPLRSSGRTARSRKT